MQRQIQSPRREVLALRERGMRQARIARRHQHQTEPIPGGGVGWGHAALAEGGVAQIGDRVHGAGSSTVNSPATGAPASWRRVCRRRDRTENPAAAAALATCAMLWT